MWFGAQRAAAAVVARFEVGAGVREFGSTHHVVHKVPCDAREKLRAVLIAGGYPLLPATGGSADAHPALAMWSR